MEAKSAQMPETVKKVIEAKLLLKSKMCGKVARLSRLEKRPLTPLPSMIAPMYFEGRLPTVRKTVPSPRPENHPKIMNKTRMR